jgi:hypothetical protein
MTREIARPLSEWREDTGSVTWWKFPIDEPAWIGTPMDTDWPGYHSHFTPHPEHPEHPELPRPEETLRELMARMAQLQQELVLRVLGDPRESVTIKMETGVVSRLGQPQRASPRYPQIEVDFANMNGNINHLSMPTGRRLREAGVPQNEIKEFYDRIMVTESYAAALAEIADTVTAFNLPVVP